MKKILRVVLFAVLCVSCQKDNSVVELTNLLSNLGDEKQTFLIATDSTTQIQGKYGVKITINPDDLIFEEGSKLNQKIRLELTELTTKGALVRHDAQTVSNGKWLISGGAYHIAFFDSEENELSLKRGKVIEVEFPKRVSEPMKFFSGERFTNGMMNWIETDQILSDKKLITQLIEKHLILDEERTAKNRVDTRMEKFLVKNLGLLTLTEIDEVCKSQEIDSVFFKKDSVLLFKQIIPLESSTFLNQVNKIHSFNFISFYEKVKISKLGWINVDRFYPEIIDRVILKLNNGKEFDLVYIIDQNNNTILNLPIEEDYEISIPKGINFKIIGFKLEGDKLYAGSKVLKLKNNREIGLKKKEISINQVDDFINQ